MRRPFVLAGALLCLAVLPASPQEEESATKTAAECLEELGAAEDEVRQRAEERLKELLALTVDALRDALRSDAPAAERKRAREAFWSIARASVPLLAACLESEDRELRKSAIKALERLGREAVPALPALSRALGDESATVRRRAARALGALGRDALPAVPALAEALAKDTSVGVRKAAALALGAIGPAAEPLAGPALEAALRDPETDVRAAATAALRLVKPRAVEDRDEGQPARSQRDERGGAGD